MCGLASLPHAHHQAPSGHPILQTRPRATLHSSRCAVPDDACVRLARREVAPAAPRTILHSRSTAAAAGASPSSFGAPTEPQAAIADSSAACIAATVSDACSITRDACSTAREEARAGRGPDPRERPNRRFSPVRQPAGPAQRRASSDERAATRASHCRVSVRSLVCTTRDIACNAAQCVLGGLRGAEACDLRRRRYGGGMRCVRRSRHDTGRAGT